jgi:stage V sporulation protein SpoVS
MLLSKSRSSSETRGSSIDGAIAALIESEELATIQLLILFFVNKIQLTIAAKVLSPVQKN